MGTIDNEPLRIFRAYFKKACDVEAPEVHFNIDQYTDATLVSKPQMSIRIGELVNTHSKLLEYQEKIIADPADRLHELLDALGEKAPTVQEITGGKCDLYPSLL